MYHGISYEIKTKPDIGNALADVFVTHAAGTRPSLLP